MEQFGDYAYYYNAFYKDKDYGKEARDVNTLLKRYGQDVQDIIVYGCGTGNHDAELIKLGYHLQGIDMSPQMIEEARKRAVEQNLAIEYDVADIRTYEPHRKYDAVVSLFHVMSYQTGNEDIKNALTTARKALNSGGLLLFDCWYGPGVLTDPPAVRIKEVEDEDYRLVRLCIPEIFDKRDAVDVNYEILVINKKTGNTQTIRETHHMRYYFYPEMEEFLSEAGFRLLSNMDCQSLDDTDFSSWTCYFVAKAI